MCNVSAKLVSVKIIVETSVFLNQTQEESSSFLFYFILFHSLVLEGH